MTDQLITMPEPIEQLPKRITNMHKMFGQLEGKTCGTCLHCNAHISQPGRTYYKCNLNRITRGAATDWLKSWPACKMYIEKVKP